jgi:hypothetical protein
MYEEDATIAPCAARLANSILKGLSVRYLGLVIVGLLSCSCKHDRSATLEVSHAQALTLATAYLEREYPRTAMNYSPSEKKFDNLPPGHWTFFFWGAGGPHDTLTVAVNKTNRSVRILRSSPWLK